MSDQVKSGWISGGFGCLVMLAGLAFALVQLYAGWLGIAHHLGDGWAYAATLALFMFRLALPFVVGSFFCAMNVWGWHWAGALLFAVPGLAFAVPSVIAEMMRLLVSKFKPERDLR